MNLANKRAYIAMLKEKLRKAEVELAELEHEASLETGVVEVYGD